MPATAPLTVSLFVLFCITTGFYVYDLLVIGRPERQRRDRHRLAGLNDRLSGLVSTGVLRQESYIFLVLHEKLQALASRENADDVLECVASWQTVSPMGIGCDEQLHAAIMKSRPEVRELCLEALTTITACVAFRSSMSRQVRR